MKGQKQLELLAGMERGLQGRQTVVLQHVQKSLYTMSGADTRFTLGDCVPSCQHCRGRGRGFWRSCAEGLNECGLSSRTGLSPCDTRRTKLRENVPEPVNNEHGACVGGRKDEGVVMRRVEGG